MPFTESQQNVIDFKGKNMLVSASAGTGKTTVMIERITKLIAEGADISELVVVTFTNLAAAEMKNRLAEKLAGMRNNSRIVDQLEKLDTASICTLHSFCVEILRNWFYVVDIDPSFAILDSVTAETLRTNALDDVFHQYFRNNDEVFKKVYKIFATGRKEDNFKTTLLKLYDFSRCLENFDEWYNGNRTKFVDYSEDNPIVTVVLKDITEKLAAFCAETEAIAAEFEDLGGNRYAAKCRENAHAAAAIDCSALGSAFDGLFKFEPVPLGTDVNLRQKDCPALCDKFNESVKRLTDMQQRYVAIGRGRPIEEVWAETAKSVEFTDKLVEILRCFDDKFFEEKKQRGGLDFNDLEHLTLKVLNDPEALEAIRARYKLVFVDEYQDINPVQEAIISRLAADSRLFMVGDVKQSIYGFRGCDPTIFLQKYKNFRRMSEDAQNCEQNRLVELNTNFRSNTQILQFVNDVFDFVMTENFGKVDYLHTSRLEGVLTPREDVASVQLDLVLKQNVEAREATEIYDITAQNVGSEAVTQGDVIAQKISEFAKLPGIGYGDIVVLLRNFKENAVDIYNALVEHNIPVAANFKTESFSNKEVRDIINFLRSVDNPYNDIYTVGACLSAMGGFTENDLAEIKIATEGERIPFYARMTTFAQTYAQNCEISEKIKRFFALSEDIRLYSHGATVDEVVLKILEKTQYHLYVQGFPNGTLRLRKLYSFVDSLKGASFAQSISKFLYFLDRSDMAAEENVAAANAVRLMTMHASKGLEFPVVILADTEHNFFAEPMSVSRNAEVGLAMKYYDFDQMRVYETLGTCACNMFDRKTRQEEEMRLLYVAMTRAKSVLDIVGTISEKDQTKAPASAVSHLDWVLSALRRKYGKDIFRLVSDNVASEKITLHTQKPQVSVAREELLCPQYTDEAAVMAKLNYVYPFADQTKMPTKLVSSALDREYINSDEDGDGSVALSSEDDRNALGTAYHRLYQYVDYNANADGVLSTVAGLVNQGKITPEIAKKLNIDLILSTLRNPDLRRLTDGGGQVFREMPFMLVAPYNQIAKDGHFSDEVMLQGVIDLLVLRQNSAAVVDFKFSAHSADRLSKDYRYQLQSYRLAVQKICGISDVDCYILSIEENKLIKL